MLWRIDAAGGGTLAEQIAANVRRGIADGELPAGGYLPTSVELAGLLGVNANTVLAAYRALRTEGVLEFRRGRGVRVLREATTDAPALEAARAFLDVASRHGYGHDDLPALLDRARGSR